MNDAIISIKPRHVEKILSGEKTVELRTRSISLPLGSRLWIYATLPVGKIELSAEVGFIETLSPKSVWSVYGDDICILKKEFNNYTSGRTLVTAIGLTNVQPLEKAICLETLRTYEKDFQPPQFFSRLHADRELYSAFY